MLPWDRRAERINRVVSPEEIFTEAQLARLMTLREYVVRYQAGDEHGIDEHRLEFARWLVQNDKLSEERE